MNIPDVFKQLLTGKDNTTQDLGRWSWAISIATVIGTAAWQLHLGTAVDLQTLATALATVAGAHGAALWAKRSTEPTEGLHSA